VPAAPKYFTRINNLEQGRQIEFDLALVPEGPREKESWVADITIRKVHNPTLTSCVDTPFTGIGATKGSAKDAAAYLALKALGAL